LLLVTQLLEKIQKCKDEIQEKDLDIEKVDAINEEIEKNCIEIESFQTSN